MPEKLTRSVVCYISLNVKHRVQVMGEWLEGEGQKRETQTTVEVIFASAVQNTEKVHEITTHRFRLQNQPPGNALWVLVQNVEEPGIREQTTVHRTFTFTLLRRPMSQPLTNTSPASARDCSEPLLNLVLPEVLPSRKHCSSALVLPHIPPDWNIFLDPAQTWSASALDPFWTCQKHALLDPPWICRQKTSPWRGEVAQ